MGKFPRFILFLIWTFVAWAQASQFTAYEGEVSGRHDLEFNELRQKYIVTNGYLDGQKISFAIEFLKTRRQQLESSVYMQKKMEHINRRGYGDKEASEEALEELEYGSESRGTFDFAIEQLEALLKFGPLQLTPTIQDKVDNALLLFTSANTLVPENIFTDDINDIKNVLTWFMKVKPSDPKLVPASNLLYNGDLQSPRQVEDLKKSGLDISKLDPPSSPFWTNNVVENYDPEEETFLGEQLLPGREIRVPEFKYTRFGQGTIKIKAFWEDANQKKKRVSLRVGREVHTSVVASQLARALGYPAIPTYFRSRVKLHLGKASYSEFVNQWKSMNGDQHGGPSSYIEQIPGENAIFLNNVSIEAYPSKGLYRKLGQFRTGKNGFGNRREYRALFMYLALIAQQDTGDDQVRMDAVWDSEQNIWRPQFFFSDTGYSMGSSVWWNNLGTANMYPWKLVSKDKMGGVRIWWAHGGYNPKTFKSMTYDDAKWIVRRMTRLSEMQIQKIVNASGWPGAVKTIYVEKIKSRINDLAKAFNVDHEGRRPHVIKTKNQLHIEFPELIDENGYLTEKIESLPNSTQPLLGNRFTPVEVAVSEGLNFLNEKLNMSTDYSTFKSGTTRNLGYTMTSYGVGIHGSRTIELNELMGPGQNRYTAKDVLNFTIPLGIIGNRLTTPVAININYQVIHYHSYETLIEAEKKRFFKWINPFSYKSIQKNLKTGDRLEYRHSLVGSVGRLGVSPMDRIELTLAPLFLSGTLLKEISIQRPFQNMIEVVDISATSAAIGSALNLEVFLKLAAGLSFRSEKKQMKVFRINDSLNNAHIEVALQKYWLNHDAKGLEKLVQPISVSENSKISSLNLGLFVWNWFIEKSKQMSEFITGDIEEGEESELGQQRSVVFNRKFSSNYGRGISRDWNDNIFIDRDGPKVIEVPIDIIFAPAATEGRSQSIAVEGVANSDFTDFSDIDVRIDYKFIDKWCTKEEYESIRQFFNQKVNGDRRDVPYLGYEFPEGLKRISPFLGQMHWQIKKEGLMELLYNLQKNKSLNLYATEGELGFNDQMARISSFLRKYNSPILKNLDEKTKRKALDKKLKSLISLLRELAGTKGADIHKIRSLISESKMWIVTRLFNVHRLSTPTLYKTGDHYAPEIGQFQGHRFVDKFRFKNLVTPHMTTPALISRELDPKLMGALEQP